MMLLDGLGLCSPSPPPDAVGNILLSPDPGVLAEGATAGTQVALASTNLGDVSVSWSVDNVKFTVDTPGSSVAVRRSGSGTVTAGVPETINLTATRSGTTPYTKQFTVTVTAETVLTTYRWVNGSSAQTNVPLVHGFQFEPGVFTAGTKVTAYKNGVTSLEVQEDLHATPPSASTRRHVSVCAVLPTADPDEVVDIEWRLAGGSPDTGTDITEADILATTFDAYVEQIIGGITYYARARDPLAASAGTAWVMGTPKNFGQYCSGGGLRNMFFLWSPLRKVSDNSAHATGGVYFYIDAFKGERGAVSPSNPITIEWKARLWNGWLRIASPTNIQSSLTVSQDTTPVDVVDYPTTLNVPATLTLSSSATGDRTATFGVGFSIDQNSVGAVIKDHATGVAVISAYISPTSATVRVFNAFSATTFASGDWDFIGLNHCYNDWWMIEGWWGRDPVAMPRPLTEYFLSTQMVLDWNKPAASITLNMAQLDALGDRPFSGAGREFNGDFPTNLGATGASQNIGVDPVWCIDGLLKVDASGYFTDDGYTKIFKNAVDTGLVPWHVRNEATGLVPKFNTGTNWNWNPAFSGGTSQIFPSGTTPSRQNNDLGHHPMSYYIPYLLTGHPIWLDAMGEMAYFFWASINMGFSGSSQMTRVFIGRDHAGPSNGEITTSQGQMRSQAWAFRSLTDLLAVIPDNVSSAVFSQVRSGYMGTYFENYQSLCVADYVDHTTALPDPAEEFTDDGPRYTAVVSNAPGMDTGFWYYGNYQADYFRMALEHAIEMEVLNADGDDFVAWFLEGMAGAVSQTDAPTDGLLAFQWQVCQTTGRTYYQTWGLTFGQTRERSQYSDWVYGGTLTITLPDGTSGTNIRVVASAPTWTVDAVYEDAWFGIVGGGGRTGHGRVVSVVDATTMRVDTTVTGFNFNGATFNTTSYAAATWTGPLPLPADWTDQTLRLGSTGFGFNDYMRAAYAVALTAAARGATDMDTVRDYIATWASNTGVDLTQNSQFTVGARS